MLVAVTLVLFGLVESNRGCSLDLSKQWRRGALLLRVIVRNLDGPLDSFCQLFPLWSELLAVTSALPTNVDEDGMWRLFNFAAPIARCQVDDIRRKLCHRSGSEKKQSGCHKRHSCHHYFELKEQSLERLCRLIVLRMIDVAKSRSFCDDAV